MATRAASSKKLAAAPPAIPDPLALPPTDPNAIAGGGASSAINSGVINFDVEDEQVAPAAPAEASLFGQVWVFLNDPRRHASQEATDGLTELLKSESLLTALDLEIMIMTIYNDAENADLEDVAIFDRIKSLFLPSAARRFGSLLLTAVKAKDYFVPSLPAPDNTANATGSLSAEVAALHQNMNALIESIKLGSARVTQSSPPTIAAVPSDAMPKKKKGKSAAASITSRDIARQLKASAVHRSTSPLSEIESYSSDASADRDSDDLADRDSDDSVDRDSDSDDNCKKPDDDGSNDDDDTSSISSGVSRISHRRHPSDPASALTKAIAVRAGVIAEFKAMFKNKESMDARLMAEKLSADKKLEGLPFIAANGAIYFERHHNLANKNKTAKRMCEMVCGPKGQELPPKYRLTKTAISLGIAVRSIAELNRWFDEQKEALNPYDRSTHGLSDAESKSRLRCITAYHKMLVKLIRTDTGMKSGDLGRDPKSGTFQYSDFMILIIAHYNHWHECVARKRFSDLVDNFKAAFSNAEQTLSSRIKDMDDSISWTDVGIYFGMRCTTPSCRMAAMCQEFCISCQRFPWLALSSKPKSDADYKHWLNWCNNGDGKKFAREQRRAEYKKAFGKDPGPKLQAQDKEVEVKHDQALERIRSTQNLIGLPTDVKKDCY